MKIPTILKNSIPDDLILLLDKNGIIQEVHFNSLSSKYNTLLEGVTGLFAVGNDVNTYFEVINKKDPSPFSRGKTRPGVRTLQSRPEAFKFHDDFANIHYRPPAFLLTLHPLDEGGFTGLLRPSAFLQSFTLESDRSAVFCADSQGVLFAYNTLFLKSAGLDRKEGSGLLGKEAGLFFSPSPRELQEQERKQVESFDVGPFSPVFEADFRGGIEKSWPGPLPAGFASLTEGLFHDTGDDRHRSLILPPVLDGQRTDLCVEIRVKPGNPPPCVILGDRLESGEEVTDADGYLLGPHGFRPVWVVKKRGRTLHTVPAGDTISQGGLYRYYWFGRSFRMERESRTLFFYADDEAIERGPTALSLFFRANTRTRVESCRVLARPRPISQGVRNHFVSAPGRPGSWYLLSRLNHFDNTPGVDGLSIYRLQDLADLRARFRDLEAGYRSVAEQYEAADRKLKELTDESDTFVGSAPEMRRVRDQAERVARSGAPVLLEGPTGAGKEVLARHLHRRSADKPGPFVKVDCSTLPPPLMESLLFGHVKGAFTGAVDSRKGLFEQARGGTLFLDEIGNLGLDVQAKLLRFLEDHTLVPVGGGSPVTVDLRVITATNAPLTHLIRKGFFREDLYFRIAVVVLKLPPLRDRKEDLPVLCDHFLKLFALKYGRALEGLTPGASALFYGYDWPGNIRELKNVLERAFLFTPSGPIDERVVEFPRSGDAELPAPESAHQGRKKFSHVTRDPSEITALFARHGGIARRVADELGVTRQTLYNFLKKQGLPITRVRKKPGQENRTGDQPSTR